MSNESFNFLELFKEKKYSEILSIIENKIPDDKLNSSLFNLSGVRLFNSLNMSMTLVSGGGFLPTNSIS